MTLDECIERAALEMEDIYQQRIGQLIGQMISHGANRDDIDEFKAEQRQQFESWRADELEKMRTALMDQTLH